MRGEREEGEGREGREGRGREREGEGERGKREREGRGRTPPSSPKEKGSGVTSSNPWASSRSVEQPIKLQSASSQSEIH